MAKNVLKRALFWSATVASMSAALLPAPEAAARDWTNVQLRDIQEQLVPNRVVKGDREFDGHGPEIKSDVKLFLSEDRRHIKAKVTFRAKETRHDWSETVGEWTRTVYDAPAGRTIKSIHGAVNDEGALVPTRVCPAPDNGREPVRCVWSEVKFVSEAAGFQLLMPSSSWTRFIDDLARLVEQVIEAENQLNDRDEPTREERQAIAIAEAIRRGSAFLPSEENKVYLKEPDNGGPVRLFAIVGDTGGPDISTDTGPNSGDDDTRINAIVFRKLRIELD